MIPTVLAVDDSMLIRHSVCRFFERHNYSVESACDGEEAIAVLAHIRPRVIVTDLVMPKLSGYDLIARLRRDPLTRDIPIIVLASCNSVAKLQPEHRADYIVIKDVNIIEQLEKALDRLTNA